MINDLLNNVKLINKQTKESNFSELELKLHEAFAQAERKCMSTLLEHYDWDYPEFKSAGKSYRKASRNTKKYMTLAGEVKLKRSLYRTERNGITTCPLELNAGLIDNFWTSQAAKQAIHLVSLITPSEAEHVFKEFALMTPSKSSLDRLPKKLSQQWEAKQLELDKIIQNDFEIPDDATMCSVSLDGVLIPTRYTRVLPSDSRWAEAACGTISFYDKTGDMLSTRYLARMPEFKKKTLKQQLAEHIKSIVESRPVLNIVKVADGARDNWTFLDEQIKEGESVLDFYHAAQHLFNAIECIHGKKTLETAMAFKKYRGFLRYQIGVKYNIDGY